MSNVSGVQYLFCVPSWVYKPSSVSLVSLIYLMIVLCDGISDIPLVKPDQGATYLVMSFPWLHHLSFSSNSMYYILKHCYFTSLHMIITLTRGQNAWAKYHWYPGKNIKIKIFEIYILICFSYIVYCTLISFITARPTISLFSSSSISFSSFVSKSHLL